MGFLLVVGHTDQGHQGAQQDAQHQGDGRDQQRGAHALDVLQPPVIVQKCLIKLDEEILGEAQGFPAFCQCRKRLELCFHPLHNLSCMTKRRRAGSPACLFPVGKTAYSAVMYLSMMLCTVPSACSSSRAPLMASSSWVLPLATPMA